MPESQIVRVKIGTRSPDGQYAIVRYFTADGHVFHRTHTWARAVAMTAEGER